MKGEGFLPPHGQYRDLKAFQKAEIVYDGTHRFCLRFLSRGDRTIDRMGQAAPSGKQNIVEGSSASGKPVGRRGRESCARLAVKERLAPAVTLCATAP